MPATSWNRARPGQVIGILGGLGPYAHLDLERKLLTAARELAGAVRDQDYPEWILSSVPQTPDRTAAIRGTARSPLPWLLRSLRRLEPRTLNSGEVVPGADFVIVACNSAHPFLDALRAETELPILDMIGECAGDLGRQLEARSRVGLLATTGTLESKLYHRSLDSHGLSPRSLLDAAGGEELQERLVMEAIYGPVEDGRHTGLGIKSGSGLGEARDRLRQAATVLVEELGCQTLIAACTEIPLALPGPQVLGATLVDPVEIIARVAIRRVYGLPDG